jgi:anti-sigma factor RsiW
MKHEEAIDLMAAEKYLLGELSPELRDSFEEHFFSCQDCAADVRASAAFLQHSKKLLAAQPAAEVTPVPLPAKPRWFGWLRPAIALPVMALLVAIVGYQNFVTYPKLKNDVAELRTPQILPVASLINSNARGGTTPAVTIQAGQPFLLFVDIPSSSAYTSYVAELQGPDGDQKWSLTIPPQATRDTVPIRVPAGVKTAGMYVLIVRGIGNAGVNAEVGRYPFSLKLQ